MLVFAAPTQHIKPRPRVHEILLPANFYSAAFLMHRAIRSPDSFTFNKRTEVEVAVYQQNENAEVALNRRIRSASSSSYAMS